LYRARLAAKTARYAGNHKAPPNPINAGTETNDRLSGKSALIQPQESAHYRHRGLSPKLTEGFDQLQKFATPLVQDVDPVQGVCSRQERPMAPRASWKGYLKLSLVSCPIALYPAASSSERISFNRINKKTGNRLKQQLVDAETGDTVEKEDIGRGYEIGKGQYLQIEDEEIEKIRIESSHTITIDTFVPRSEIDDRYIGCVCCV